MPVGWSPPTADGVICSSKWFGGCTAPLGLFPTLAQCGLEAGATSTAADGCVGLQGPALEGLSHPMLHSGLAVGMESPLEPPACGHRPGTPQYTPQTGND